MRLFAEEIEGGKILIICSCDDEEKDLDGKC